MGFDILPASDVGMAWADDDSQRCHASHRTRRLVLGPNEVIPPGPDNSITEFPLFTFLYSDLHAHMIVMPLALLALSWALSVVAAKPNGRIRLRLGWES